MMSRQAALPPTLAPRLINREATAAHVNVSPNTFDEVVNHCTHGEVGRTIIRPEILQLGH